jgi:hypothetical protein
MKFSCSSCGQHIETDQDVRGLEVTCPTCSKAFTVPGDLGFGPPAATAAPIAASECGDDRISGAEVYRPHAVQELSDAANFWLLQKAIKGEHSGMAVSLLLVVGGIFGLIKKPDLMLLECAGILVGGIFLALLVRMRGRPTLLVVSGIITGSFGLVLGALAVASIIWLFLSFIGASLSRFEQPLLHLMGQAACASYFIKTSLTSFGAYQRWSPAAARKPAEHCLSRLGEIDKYLSAWGWFKSRPDLIELRLGHGGLGSDVWRGWLTKGFAVFRTPAEPFIFRKQYEVTILLREKKFGLAQPLLTSKSNLPVTLCLGHVQVGAWMSQQCQNRYTMWKQETI